MSLQATRPLADGFGREVESLDLKEIHSGQVNELLHLLAREGLVLVRGQQLSDDDILRFGERLGQIDTNPNMDATRLAGKLLHFSNLHDDSGRPLGALGQRPLKWHVDNYFRERPTISFLHSVEIPTRGGTTYFASNRLAYEALPQPLARAVESKSGVFPMPDPQGEPRTVRIPLVLASPSTGRKALYFSLEIRRVAELGWLRGQWLLRRLARIATRDEHVYSHAWRVGDVLLWDNAQIMHRRDGFSEPRLMKAMRLLVPSDLFAAPMHHKA